MNNIPTKKREAWNIRTKSHIPVFYQTEMKKGIDQGPNETEK